MKIADRDGNNPVGLGLRTSRFRPNFAKSTETVHPIQPHDDRLEVSTGIADLVIPDIDH